MKKLIIALVAVAMGVAANAAAVTWTASVINPNADQTDVTKYMAYAIDTSIFKDAITADNYKDAIAAATSSVGIQKTTASATTGKVPNGTKFTDEHATGEYVTYVTLIIDNALGSESGFAVSAPKTAQVTAAGALAMSFGSLAAATADGAWTATGAPEPTSAMLVLLGIAGLALKRKQA